MPNDEQIYYPPIYYVITNKGIASTVQVSSPSEALIIAGHDKNINVFVRPTKNGKECDFVTNVILDITKKYNQLALLSNSAEKALDISEQEADKSIGVTDGTVHSGLILFGLLSEEHGIAGKFLRERNIKKEEISDAIKKFSDDVEFLSFFSRITFLTTRYGMFIDTRFLLLSAVIKSQAAYEIIQKLGLAPEKFISDFLLYLKQNNCGIGDYILSSFSAVNEISAHPDASEIYKFVKTPSGKESAIRNHLRECSKCLRTAEIIRTSPELAGPKNASPVNNKLLW